MTAPPAVFHYPILVKIERANGRVMRCSTNFDAPALERFLLEAEWLDERLRAARQTGSEKARQTVHDEITREFFHHLDAAVKASIQPPVQIEPLYSLMHACMPAYAVALDIRDPSAGLLASIMVAASEKQRRQADNEIAFTVHEDDVTGKTVLRTGHLLIPYQDNVIAYRYEDVSGENAPGMRFRLHDKRWPTIDEAAGTVRGAELASVVSVRAPQEYDIARSILPLFAWKYPILEKTDDPNKGDDWEILSIDRSEP